MKTFSEIKNQIFRLRIMFEKDKSVDSRMWEKLTFFNFLKPVL